MNVYTGSIILKQENVAGDMSKSLYNEAIADAQKLRELAEETAKNRVVEAVMPKIRDMVNRRILGEQVLEDEEVDIEMSSSPAEEEVGVEEVDSDLLGAMLAPLPAEAASDDSFIVDDESQESEARRTHVR